MITIGQLADCAGVTVRAVRHYHQRGLLGEPSRDASGYRRYSAQDAIDLIKIRILADAGIPLARVKALMAADTEEFDTAIAEIDQSLRTRIDEMHHARQRIAELVSGERLFVPEQVADYLDRLRALGVSNRTVEMEREGWMLLRMTAPDLVPGWITEKATALDDIEFQRLYLEFDRAFDWSPDDPRLTHLAQHMAAWSTDRNQEADLAQSPPDAVTAGLLDTLVRQRSPAWDQLNRILRTVHPSHE